MARCMSCYHFDSREGYCPVQDRDVHQLTHACEYWKHWATILESEDDE